MSLLLEYEPEGLVEKAGDAMHLIERQAQADLDRFKEFIESEEYATGAWRGAVSSNGGTGTPGVLAAAASRGDDGKAGVSGKAVAAGVGVAAAAAAAAVAATKGRSGGNAEVDPAAPVETHRKSKTVDSRGARMLTDEEIEAGAADVPLDASNAEPERR